MATTDTGSDAQTVMTESTAGGALTPTTGSFSRVKSVDEWLSSSRGSNSHAIFDMLGPLKVTRNADPAAKEIFLIIDKSTNRALTCHNGQLYLEAGTKATSSWQWCCARKNGFFGLENVAEGGFLGHNLHWNFQATVKHHLGWEYLSFEKRASGGYWIKAPHWWTYWQLSAKTNNEGLFAERDDGTLWEFVKVHRD